MKMRNPKVAKAASDRLVSQARQAPLANPQFKVNRLPKSMGLSESCFQHLIAKQIGMMERRRHPGTNGDFDKDESVQRKGSLPKATPPGKPRRKDASHPGGKAVHDRRVASLIERLKENPALSINNLASIVNLSPSRLRHLVQKEDLGFNLQSFRKECQLELACQLLRKNDLPLKEIRSRCGIPDGANFNRFFKNCLNTTPGEFRLQTTTAFTNK